VYNRQLGDLIMAAAAPGWPPFPNGSEGPGYLTNQTIPWTYGA